MGGREECSKQSPVGSWSCFPHPILVLWASGTLGGRDRWVAESDFPVGFLHSPLRARVGPLPAFTASSDWLRQCPMPHPAQAPLFSRLPQGIIPGLVGVGVVPGPCNSGESPS